MRFSQSVMSLLRNRSCSHCYRHWSYSPHNCTRLATCSLYDAFKYLIVPHSFFAKRVYTSMALSGYSLSVAYYVAVGYRYSVIAAIAVCLLYLRYMCRELKPYSRWYYFSRISVSACSHFNSTSSWLLPKWIVHHGPQLSHSVRHITLSGLAKSDYKELIQMKYLVCTSFHLHIDFCNNEAQSFQGSLDTTLSQMKVHSPLAHF